VPPSITYSVPVIEAARGETRKVTRSATSFRLGGPAERNAAETVHDDLLATLVVRTGLAARRSASATAASVSTQPGETRMTRTPLGVTSFESALLYVESGRFGRGVSDG